MTAPTHSISVMPTIERILHWNDEESRMWRAGLLAASRNRVHGLAETKRGALVIGACAAAITALTLLR